MSLGFIRMLLCIGSFITAWALNLAAVFYIAGTIGTWALGQAVRLWNSGVLAVAPMVGPVMSRWVEKLLWHPHLHIMASIMDAVRMSLPASLILLSITIIIHWLRPLRKDMEILGGKMAMVSSEGAGAYLYAILDRALKEHEGKGVPRPAIYISSSSRINAYAISKSNRAAIILTKGMASAFDHKRLCWVVGHEMGHVVHGDTWPNMLWISANSIERAMLRIIYWLMVIAVRIGGIGLGRLVWPIALGFKGLRYLSGYSSKLASTVFNIADAYIMRKTELRADAFASRFAEPEYGLDVLERIGGAIEPTYGLFASHPQTAIRIRAIEAELARRGKGRVLVQSGK